MPKFFFSFLWAIENINTWVKAKDIAAPKVPQSGIKTQFKVKLKIAANKVICIAIWVFLTANSKKIENSFSAIKKNEAPMILMMEEVGP